MSRFVPAESTCVSFWSARCGLCESCPAHQVPVFRSLVVASAYLVHETCVPDSRHGMHHDSRNLTCPSHPTKKTKTIQSVFCVWRGGGVSCRRSVFSSCPLFCLLCGAAWPPPSLGWCCVLHLLVFCSVAFLRLFRVVLPFFSLI